MRAFTPVSMLERAHLLEDLAVIDSVLRVRSVLNDDFQVMTERLSGWIDEALAQWPGRRTAPT